MLINKNGQLAFHAAKNSGDMKLIEKFDKFCSTSVSDEYIRSHAKALLEEVNPFIPETQEALAVHHLMTMDEYEYALQHCNHRPLAEFIAGDQSAA